MTLTVEEVRECVYKTYSPDYFSFDWHDDGTVTITPLRFHDEPCIDEPCGIEHAYDGRYGDVVYES